MTQRQFEIFNMLNEMYYAQSIEFREQYKTTYIAICDYIFPFEPGPLDRELSYEEINKACEVYKERRGIK